MDHCRRMFLVMRLVKITKMFLEILLALVQMIGCGETRREME